MTVLSYFIMTELEHYIKSYFGIPREDLSSIVSFFHPTTLEKGHYFLKEGQICNQLSFIRSGIIRVYVATKEKEVTQWVGTQGYFITDLSGIMFQKPGRWNIQALIDCEFYTINSIDYHNLGHIIPRWHQLEKLFIARCFTVLEDRIFQFLSMSAEERYNILFEANPELFNQVPLQYLASMIGMTPETFSRIRNKRL